MQNNLLETSAERQRTFRGNVDEYFWLLLLVVQTMKVETEARGEWGGGGWGGGGDDITLGIWIYLVTDVALGCFLGGMYTLRANVCR